MKTLIALLFSCIGGCVSLQLDMPTKHGRVGVTMDGSQVLLRMEGGFAK